MNRLESTTSHYSKGKPTFPDWRTSVVDARHRVPTHKADDESSLVKLGTIGDKTVFLRPSDRLNFALSAKVPLNMQKIALVLPVERRVQAIDRGVVGLDGPQIADAQGASPAEHASSRIRTNRLAQTIAAAAVLSVMGPVAADINPSTSSHFGTRTAAAGSQCPAGQIPMPESAEGDTVAEKAADAKVLLGLPPDSRIEDMTKNGRTLHEGDCVLVVDPGSSSDGSSQTTVPKAESQSSKSAQTGEYVVVRGDSWYEIAVEHGISLESLAEANGHTVAELENVEIHPDDVIKLPGNSSSTSPTATVSATQSSIIPQGEPTVVDIPKECTEVFGYYQITQEDMRSKTPLTDIINRAKQEPNVISAEIIDIHPSDTAAKNAGFPANKGYIDGKTELGENFRLIKHVCPSGSTMEPTTPTSDGDGIPEYGEKSTVGDRDHIFYVQSRLAYLGFMDWKDTTGNFGDKTLGAVREFYKVHFPEIDPTSIRHFDIFGLPGLKLQELVGDGFAYKPEKHPKPTPTTYDNDWGWDEVKLGAAIAAGLIALTPQGRAAAAAAARWVFK